MQIGASTAAEWDGVLAEFATRKQDAIKQAERMRAEKRELALTAAMGSDIAQKRLAKLNDALSTASQNADDLDAAIQHGQAERKRAAEREAAEAEATRREQMSNLARQVVQHAAVFSARLRQAADEGDQMKKLLHEMAAMAQDYERSTTDVLLGPGPYDRALLAAGLRAHCRIDPYSGPQSHIEPLEDQAAAILANLIQADSSKKAA